VLIILPANGVYYQWQEDDRLSEVASSFGVDPQVIIEYPGNHFDLTEIDLEHPQIEPGTWLIIPGGRQEFAVWDSITRSEPAESPYDGPGNCGQVYGGIVGTGWFAWPADNSAGYHTLDAQPGIGITGNEGDPVYAADNGVIVYAGWNDDGYGNLIVIDHYEWQSVYAHLSDVYVDCGQNVFQGAIIGTIGSTGDASGSYLCFELIYDGESVNPLSYLP